MTDVTTTASLYRRLLSLLLLAMGALGALLMLQASLSAHRGADRAYDRLLDAASRVLAEQVSWQGGQLWFDVPASALEMLAPSGSERVFYSLVDDRGDFVSGNVMLPPLSPPVPGPFQSATITWHGMTLRLGTRQARLSGWQRHDHFEIRVAHTQEARNALAQQLLQGSMLRLGGITLLSIAAVIVAIRMALAPLQRLRHALRNRHMHDLAPLQLPVPRELGELVGALNELLERQRRANAHQQRFIGDASHQLRTPLAGLSIRAELALRSDDAQQWRSALQAMQQSAGNAARLASQLLSLTRLQSPDAPIERTPIDLEALARETLKQALARHGQCHLDLGMASPGQPVIVSGAPWQLEEALVNLIDNAVRHAHHLVTIGVDPAPPTLWVEDDGPGIPREQRAEALRPFHRGSENGPGSGLGLSIVAGIAEAHGARLLLEDAVSGQGLCVRLIFAAAVDSSPCPASPTRS